MDIQTNVSLKNDNTFGVEATAKYFAEIYSLADLQSLVMSEEFQKNQRLILGGGSNILFTRDFDGLVIKNNLLGKKILDESDDTVTVEIASGENWHEAVLWATEHGWGGIENLALIPGSVGATPVQNIGAYGVELCDTLEKVYAVDMTNSQQKIFEPSECQFGYRDSIFKNEEKGRYFITKITLRLSKNPTVHTAYGAIKTQLDTMDVADPSIYDVRDAVIAIRQSKLPDPKNIGNAGSFFKNPIVDTETFQKLHAQYSDMPHFETENGIKIPAGWLIEQCGWKGKRVGDVGVHENQALVLVNYGGGSGAEIKNLAEQIQASVHEKFGIQLEPEVTMI